MVDDGRTTDGRTTDGRRTDGRTTEHGYTISSPCEPDGSGELITIEDGRGMKFGFTIQWNGKTLTSNLEFFNI